MSANSIGWGKCSIIIKDLDDTSSKWTKIATPKEDSTKLSTNKGDKVEATIEGGENEDTKYKKSTYTLEYLIRRNASRKKPMVDVDGVISHHYGVFVQPENITVPGPYLPKTVASLDEAFDTTDGGQMTYDHDTLSPDDGGKQVRWGTITQDLSKLKEGATIEDTAFDFKDVDVDSTPKGS